MTSVHRFASKALMLVLLVLAGFCFAEIASAQTSTPRNPTSQASVRRAQIAPAAPVARMDSRIRTQWTEGCRKGEVVIVLDTSAVPHGAQKFRITGLELPGQTPTAEIWCDAQGENKSYKDCYSCNSSVPPDVPYKAACDYLGFCTEGYNGNSSYCSFP